MIDTFAFHEAAAIGDIAREAIITGGTGGDLQAALGDSATQTLRVFSGSYFELPIRGGDPGTEWSLQGWFHQPNVWDNTGGLSMRGSTGGRGVEIGWGQQQELLIWRNTTQLFRSVPFFLSSPRYLRLHVVEHASTGTVRLFADGGLLWETLAANTSRSAAFTADRLRFQAPADRSASYNQIILKSGPPLSRFARSIMAPFSSDEGPNEWTRNTGSTDYEALETLPHDGDTAYLRSTAEGTRTRHKAAVTVPSGRRIVAARERFTVRLEDPGNDRLQVTREIGMASDDHELTGFSDDGYVSRAGEFVEENPDAEEPWTEATLSDWEIEAEHLAGA